MSALNVFLNDEEATLSFGRELALGLTTNNETSKKSFELSKNQDVEILGAVVYLAGDLGAGKTTLTRGIMRGFGYKGAVKSPTYTIIEPYEFVKSHIYHFDLYRLNDPMELEDIGFRDYLDPQTICLIEWPSKAENILPAVDYHLQLDILDNGRNVTILSATNDK